MLLKPYRETLALPGLKSLLAVATLARMPIAAGAVVLTLHVVTDLGPGARVGVVSDPGFDHRSQLLGVFSRQCSASPPGGMTRAGRAPGAPKTSSAPSRE